MSDVVRVDLAPEQALALAALLSAHASTPQALPPGLWVALAGAGQALDAMCATCAPACLAWRAAALPDCALRRTSGARRASLTAARPPPTGAKACAPQPTRPPPVVDV